MFMDNENNLHLVGEFDPKADFMRKFKHVGGTVLLFCGGSSTLMATELLITDPVQGVPAAICTASAIVTGSHIARSNRRQ